MRSSALIHICEKKGADQLHDNRTADQPGHFVFTSQSLYFLIQNFTPLANFCGSIVQFVSGLVAISKTGFLTAQLISVLINAQGYTTIHEYLTS